MLTDPLTLQLWVGATILSSDSLNFTCGKRSQSSIERHGYPGLSLATWVGQDNYQAVQHEIQARKFATNFCVIEVKLITPTRSKHNSVEKFGVLRLWSICTNLAQKIASLAVKTHLGNIHNCRSWVTDSFFDDSKTERVYSCANIYYRNWIGYLWWCCICSVYFLPNARSLW